MHPDKRVTSGHYLFQVACSASSGDIWAGKQHIVLFYKTWFSQESGLHLQLNGCYWIMPPQELVLLSPFTQQLWHSPQSSDPCQVVARVSFLSNTASFLKLCISKPLYCLIHQPSQLLGNGSLGMISKNTPVFISHLHYRSYITVTFNILWSSCTTCNCSKACKMVYIHRLFN